MKYLGSKARIAKDILPIILKNRKENQHYVEPFAGGMNLIDKVKGPRIANDIHPYLIPMWEDLVRGWVPPTNISDKQYKHIKDNKDKYPKPLVGYVGFNSFGGKWFAGYRRDNTGVRDYWAEHYRNIMKQVPNVVGTVFTNCSYLDMEIPPNSIIYCDPPYNNTTKYSTSIDYDIFWGWCRNKVKEGHVLYVSEYNAPDDFRCVWEKEITNSMNTFKTYKPTEKLFTL